MAVTRVPGRRFGPRNHSTDATDNEDRFEISRIPIPPAGGRPCPMTNPDRRTGGDNAGPARESAPLSSRLVLGGLAALLLVLSVFYGLGLAGWAMGDDPVQRLQQAWSVLLVSILLGVGGIAIGREVLARPVWSPWLLVGLLPAVGHVLLTLTG